MEAIALVLVSIVLGLAWVQVARLRYGTAKDVASLQTQFTDLAARIARFNPEDLGRLQAEINSLKVKGLWKG